MANDRLSLAEAHRILYQKLGQLPTQQSGVVRRPQALPPIRRRIYAPGETVLRAHTQADCLGLVIQGQVVVDPGRQKPARSTIVLCAGSTIGPVLPLQGAWGDASLKALTRCEIWFVCPTAPAPPTMASSPVVTASTRRHGPPLIGLWLAGVAAVLVASVLLAGQAWALVPMRLGQWCMDQGNDRCAESAWQVASALSSSNPSPALALGGLRLGRGDVAGAEQAFEAAHAAAPEGAEALNNLGVIYFNRGEAHRAVAAFRRALKLEPGTAEVEQNLGRSLQAVGAYDEALTHYQSALSVAGPEGNILTNMALIYYEMGRLAVAEDAGRQAVASGTASAPAYTVLGAVALESRRPEAALTELERALAVDGTYGPAHYYLGLAYMALDDPGKAKAALQQALENTADEGLSLLSRQFLEDLEGTEKRETSP